jgi:RNA:NAD 2'-phosphotransferase (TPT1/KptA family)
MAYHLRHDPMSPASREGWVHVEELAELLNRSGHKVTPDALLLIAGAAGEPRFEREGSDIRAAYGHSLKTTIAYEQKTPPKWLYHATPLENLRSIFEARAGLRRGRRQWVHLSDRPSIAMNASTRQHKPVALLRISTHGVKNLVYASGNTWLAPIVTSDALEIVPLRDLRELLKNDGPEH